MIMPISSQARIFRRKTMEVTDHDLFMDLAGGNVEDVCRRLAMPYGSLHVTGRLYTSGQPPSHPNGVRHQRILSAVRPGFGLWSTGPDCYRNRVFAEAMNLSNNGLKDDEGKEPAVLPLGGTAKLHSRVAAAPTGSERQEMSGAVTTAASKSSKDQQGTSTAEIHTLKVEQRRDSKAIRRGSAQRRDSRGKKLSDVHTFSDQARPRKKSIVSALKAKRPLSAQVDSRRSSSGSIRAESMNFEVDLLERASDSSMHEVKVDREAGEEEDEDEVKRPPKFTIKSLYKQLLSIGMSANAFRGITVQTSTGETKGTSEAEAEAVLNALVTKMVGGEEDAKEGEDVEEEDDEEMELIMGSLLSDVGAKDYIEVQEREETPTPVFAERKPNLELLERKVPGQKPEEKKESPTVARPPSAAREEEDMPTGHFDLPAIVPTYKKLSDAERAQQKEFLQQVATGSIFGGLPKVRKESKLKPDGFPKKKILKVPPMRLRRAIPISNPFLLCLRTPNVDLTHSQVKNMLEAQLGTIVSLQHDPEYLQNNDVHLPPRVMWVFRMEDTKESNYISICMEGIVGYDGEKLRVRKRDDVFMEEHRAYQLVKQIKDEQAQRLKNKGRKVSKISQASKV